MDFPPASLEKGILGIKTYWVIHQRFIYYIQSSLSKTNIFHLLSHVLRLSCSRLTFLLLFGSIILKKCKNIDICANDFGLG